MFELFKRWALRFAVVPPEPHAPAGTPGSIQIFRAAANYWKYLLVVWGIRQVVGAFVIVVLLSSTAVWRSASHKNPEVVLLPGLLHALELIGLGGFLIQLPFSLATTRLNYELRWYIVTDRSLRIREGIFSVREMTLTFANVQNIAIQQGPLQRLMGIADVVVRTAGGGATDGHGHGSQGAGASMHVGTLRAVDNAERVRDLILDRLRRLRDSGLGDPDDRHHHVSETPTLLAAAVGLRDEARALRRTIGGPDPDRR